MHVVFVEQFYVEGGVELLEEAGGVGEDVAQEGQGVEVAGVGWLRDSSQAAGLIFGTR